MGIARVKADGRWLYLDPSDRGVARGVFLNGRHEPTGTVLFTSLVRPGATVVDVGAHVGYYTTLAAELVQPNGRVIALEPVPKNFALLQKGIETNGYRNVKLFQCAAADRAGEMELMLIPGNTGAGMLFRPRQEGRRYIPVKTVVLDELLSDVPEVNVIKIDVEGAEMSVFDGLEKTIDRSDRLSIMMEFSSGLYRSYGYDPDAFLARMIERRFSIYEIDGAGGGLRPIGMEDRAYRDQRRSTQHEPAALQRLGPSPDGARGEVGVPVDSQSTRFNRDGPTVTSSSAQAVSA